MKWVQVQKPPKIPFYRFFLCVKLSSHFRKTKQRNEQRRWRLVGLSYSLNSYRTYTIIGNTKAKSMSVYIGARDTNGNPICNINSVHTKSRDSRVSILYYPWWHHVHISTSYEVYKSTKVLPRTRLRLYRVIQYCMFVNTKGTRYPKIKWDLSLR